MLAELLAPYTAPAEGLTNASHGRCWEVGLAYSPTWASFQPSEDLVRNPCFMIYKRRYFPQASVSFTVSRGYFFARWALRLK